MDRRCRWLTLLLLVPAVGIAAGCTYVQGRLRTSAELKNISYDQAFQIATQSATDAGFTVTSAAKDGGTITASRGNQSFILSQRQILDINVVNHGSRSTIIVAGEASVYAIIADAIKDFCIALQRREPTAVCRT